MLTMTRTRPAVPAGLKKSPLSSLDIFKSIPTALLFEIEKNMTVRTYAKRETIFLENDDADFIWLVGNGHVKETQLSPEGRTNTLCMVGTNGLFGVSAFDGGTYGFHCVAETEATVYSFHIGFFQSLLRKYPEMSCVVLSRVSKLLRRSKDMQAFARESAEKRLLHVLTEMVGQFGRTVPLTRREIAELAGTAMETCIRIFSRMEKAGLMSSTHGEITIKNLDALMDRMEKL